MYLILYTENVRGPEHSLPKGHAEIHAGPYASLGDAEAALDAHYEERSFFRIFELRPVPTKEPLKIGDRVQLSARGTIHYPAMIPGGALGVAWDDPDRCPAQEYVFEDEIERL